MRYGRLNLSVGFLTLAAFMVYGFFLIYLRDFAPAKEEWIASYSLGKHFESRLAHVHGNLFAFINIVIGYLLMNMQFPERTARFISWLAITGMLMPAGILAEIVFGAPPVFVLIGGVSMVVATAWFGLASLGLSDHNR